jgi:hypothetical protein
MKCSKMIKKINFINQVLAVLLNKYSIYLFFLLSFLQSEKSFTQFIIIASGSITVMTSAISAEGINQVFKKNKDTIFERLLHFRFKVFIPVFFLCFLLCALYFKIHLLILFIVVFRTISDWVHELFICKIIRDKNYKEINLYVIIQFSLLSIILLNTLMTKNFNFYILMLWAFTPLLHLTKEINKNQLKARNFQGIHLGGMWFNPSNYYVSSFILALSTLIFRLLIFRFRPEDFANKFIAVLSMAGLVASLINGSIGSLISYKLKYSIHRIINRSVINSALLVNLIIALLAFLVLSSYGYLLQDEGILSFTLIISLLSSVPMVLAAFIRNLRIQNGEYVAREDLIIACTVLLATLCLLIFNKSNSYLSLIYVFSSLTNLIVYAKNK